MANGADRSLVTTIKSATRTLGARPMNVVIKTVAIAVLLAVGATGASANQGQDSGKSIHEILTETGT